MKERFLILLILFLTGCDSIQPTNNNLRARVLGTPQAATTATPQAATTATPQAPAPAAIDYAASVSNVETDDGFGTATMLLIAFVGSPMVVFLYSYALSVFFSHRGAK